MLAQSEGSGSLLTGIARSPTTTRIVHGHWTSDGTAIGTPSGYTVTRTGTGSYTVVFSSSFVGFPAVTFTQIGGAVGLFVVEGLASNTFSVTFYSVTSGAPVDVMAMFIAVGRI